MKVYEEGYTVRIGDGTESRHVYVYRQPVIDRLVYLVLVKLDTLTWKTRIGKWVWSKLDAASVFAHKVRCDGACTTMYKTVGPPGHKSRDEDDPGVKVCYPMPLSASVDCKLYDLSTKNRTLVKKYT